MCRTRLIRIQNPYHNWLCPHPSLEKTGHVRLFIDPESSLSTELIILEEHRTKAHLYHQGLDDSAWFPKKGFQGYLLEQSHTQSRFYQICAWFANSIPFRKKTLLYKSAYHKQPNKKGDHP